ncbi:UNVERIFIED_CONTAM: Coiled-coil domain-containing protein 87 [Siphonaria sp. JEL0065]|nr:Coiled-coil domain-containing protein 87 [Siphonaria sp. JEL0065]
MADNQGPPGQPPIAPAANPKLSLRNGVFETWELEEKALSAAISSAEKTALVRQQIWKGTKSDPISQNSKFGRYTNVLGLIGYERLQIKPLGRVDIGDRRLNMGSSMPDSMSQSTNRPQRAQSIPALLKRIVSEIELVAWLNAEEREHLINAFISDLAHRFNHTHDLISSKYNAAQNRRIILKLFEKIGHTKNVILEKCRAKKASMDQLGIFADDANSTRVISMFRTELSRRINTADMVQKILVELEGKEAIVETVVVDNEDLFNQQVQEPLGVTHREEMFLINDMEAIVAKNALQFQSGSLALIGDDAAENKSEDPLLQAHTSAAKLSKRKRLGFSIPPVPADEKKDERYLPSSKIREIHLKDFDYSILDDPSMKTKEDHYVYQKQKMPDLTISRTMESRVSLRIPKGFINLSAEPASAVSQFGSEVDTKKIDILDEKLSRYKEIEELYCEITKTLASNHLETDDVVIDNTGCPSAPYDPKIPLTNAFKGILLSYSKPKPVVKEESPEVSETETAAFSTPQIRLTTRKYATSNVDADEFSKDRKAAMKKIVSSRYNTFKYNYGGYTPYKAEKKKKKEVVFTTDDYLDYIRTRTCDFILDLLIDSEEEAKAYQRAMEEEANRKMEEGIRARIQKEEDDKLERRRRRTLYNRGKWNVGALTHMREVQQLDKHELLNDINLDSSSTEEAEEKPATPEVKVMIAPPGIARTYEEKEMQYLSEKERQLAEAEAEAIQKHKLQKVKSDTDISGAQQELETLWVALKMPLDQKLDMAIKYGSRKFGSRLELAIKYWKKAADQILAREQVLREIDEFEGEHSNPDRYFKKGYDGSSEARMLEARIRDGHLQTLHSMEEQLADTISMIKFELNETVTYHGVPYTEKMKSDYNTILHRHQKQRPLTPVNLLPPLPKYDEEK